MAFWRAATVNEVPPGAVIEVIRGNDLYAVCNVAGEIRAISGVCPHARGPLGQGTLHGDVILCPWHMWGFDSKSGECDFNPKLHVPAFPVKVEDGVVYLDTPDA